MAPSATEDPSLKPSNELAATAQAQRHEYDVIIVGGGFAGVGAAIGARQALPSGRILLLESESCLGGAGTHRGVYSLCGLYTCTDRPRRTVGAIWDELHTLLLEMGATSEKPTRHRGVFQIFEPEGMKLALDELVSKYDVDVLLHAPVVSAERSINNTVTAVTIQERRGQTTFTGRAFIDASGDGDLAYHAGASVRYGNHGTINLGTLSTRFGGLKNASPSSALWKEAISAAKKADPKLAAKIPKVSSVQLRLPQSGDITTYLASVSYDARDARSITYAERQGKMQALEYLKILRQLPGHEGMYLVSSGPNFGTRESRHINAQYQLRVEDINELTHFDDCIAISGWGMEWHDEKAVDWASTFHLPPHEFFEIPLRCLLSQDTPNLVAAGRCLDGDRLAGSAARVMGTGLAAGQAAGVAAALIASNPGSEFPSGDEVRRILKDHGALVDSADLPPGIEL